MKKGNEQLIVCTGGGSAGHVYPAIAVAEHLTQHNNIVVYWIGSRTGIERKVVASAGIPYFWVSSGKLRRYFSWKNVRDCFCVIAGIGMALMLIKRLSPRLIFSKGGYVSVPVVIAAKICKIPIISHESDLIPGLATKINMHFSHTLLLSFKETMQYIHAKKRELCKVVGNPIRSVIQSASATRGRKYLGIDTTERMVLFLGGSLGAAQINNLVQKILSRSPTWTIVHQTGTLSSPVGTQNTPRYISKEFFNTEIADIIAAANVVVSRAGANTLTELASQAKPMILIPLSRSSSRGDQIDNANYFVHNKAAYSFLNPSEKLLVDTIDSLLHNTTEARNMGMRAQRAVILNATEHISQYILGTLSKDR